jgi:endo-1,4-beta-D-glucanase Y
MLTLAGLAVAGCAAGGSSAVSGTGGSGSPGTGGHSNSGTGGGGVSNGSGGSGNPGSSGGSGPLGSGGSGSPGSSGGSGSPNGTGGTGAPSGTGGGTSPTGSGGSSPSGSGGTGTPPASGGAGGGLARSCPSTNPDMISDFEEGSGVMIQQGTPVRTGWWYVYSATAPGGVQTPPNVPGPIAVEASGDTAMCNKYALHSTGKGFGTAPNNYSGFGAGFLPMPAPSMVKTAYDLSAYSGISFKIKSGSGTPPAVFFEMLTKENQPTTSGGTAATATIDLYNTRGHMLNAPWIPSDITTTWQTVYVPFGSLVPRWLPAVGSGMVCPAGALCQAPRFTAADVLGIQFSIYGDAGFPTPSGSTPGTYDLWVDDVQLVKDDSAMIPTLPGFPNDGPVGSCTKPANALGKYLVPAYNIWKQTFVVSAAGGMRVQRPENNNDTVSEGIAYGMLIAVYMNDQTLFDGLWTYWKSMQATSDGPLMTWNNTGGAGTATDADEDAAFAMLEASKKWPTGGYAALATSLMHAVLAHDMSGSFIKGGSNYSASDPTNPSYFAPAWYREFAKADTANAAAWNGLASGTYTLLGNIGGTSSNGLYAAWCGSNCTNIATNTGSANPAEDVLYQYDSHRIPWRIGTDYCWNGTADAKTYLSGKIIKFFATNANAGMNGIGRIADKYTPSNGNAASAVVNSASIIGTAAVGAMADPQYKTFLDAGYQLVLDLVNRGSMGDTMKNPKTTTYSYYNATVGLLTLLTMTGNIHPL